MPKVSIIVPVYKVEQYLPRCIDSILSQTFTDFELLLIDDGSPDSSGLICDEYAKKDNRIRVFHKENGGVSSARNYGLHLACGKYISFVDADDVIHPFFIETLYMLSPGNDVVVCDFIKFTKEYPFSFSQSKKESFSILHLNRENFSQHITTFSSVWNKLFTASIIKSLQFDKSLRNAEDTLFSYKALSRCNNICYIKVPLYGYFVRHDGAVGSINIIGEKDIVKVWSFIVNSELKNGSSCRHVRNAWLTHIISLFYSCTNDYVEDYLECKSILKSNLLFIMSHNCTSLNFKEKVALLLHLLFR